VTVGGVECRDCGDVRGRGFFLVGVGLISYLYLIA
jgi:hypothetical protein